MPTRKILFLVNGLGLGNSTRCDAIIDPLRRLGYRIDMVTSRNGERYFKKDPRIDHCYRCYPLDYPSKNHQLELSRAFRALPAMARSYWRNVRTLNEILAREKYEAVVSDSDYSMALLKRNYSGLVVALNNAASLFSKPSFLLKLSAGYRLHAGVEWLDYLYHRLVPDLVLSPTLQPQTEWKGKIKQVGPVVRKKTQTLKAKSKKRGPLRILIICGGSKYASRFIQVKKLLDWPDTRVDLLGPKGKDFGNLHYHPFTKDLSLIAEADLLVINGGFSSVSEAVMFKKPCVVLPIPGHAEQYFNAKTIESAGLGVMATDANWVDKLHDLRSQRKRFQKTHTAFQCPSDGAEESAMTIHQRLQHDSLRG